MQDPIERKRIATEHAQLGAQLQAAIVQQNAADALRLAAAMAHGDFFDLEQHAIPGEIELRCKLHETIDDALRLVILADDCSTDEWRQLLLPDEYDLFAHNQTLSNARWLRVAGSTRLDEQHEPMDAASIENLAGLNLRDQAKRLGRFMVVNDGATAIDYPMLRAALDPRLLPVFHDWLKCIHFPSPSRIHDASIAQNQSTAMAAFLRAQQTPHAALPASSNQSAPAFISPYHSGENTRALSVECNGNQMAALMQRFSPSDAGYEELKNSTLNVAPVAEIPDHDELIICPNWHSEHVIFRCASPLVEGMRQRGAPLVRVHSESLGLSPVADEWQANTFDIPHDPQYVLTHIGAIDRALAERGFDFAFYPEIVPINSSCWMATERIARVQATGYGFPVTSGLRTMDYFIGGTEVETENQAGDYSEQLILLPGMGVNTTQPPLASRARQRPIDAASRDGDKLRIVTTTAHQKLNRELLLAWDEIMTACPNAHLDMFTNMTHNQATLWMPQLERLIQNGDITLHTAKPRQEIIDTLAEADLYLDAFPYGGFNSLVEPLAAGCPVITLEGQRARNRLGPALMRRAQLPEALIAKSVAEYIDIAKQLIGDPGMRLAMRNRIGSRDQLFARLHDPDLAANMDAAITWMRAKGPIKRGSSKAPIIIRAGEKPALASA